MKFGFMSGNILFFRRQRAAATEPGGRGIFSSLNRQAIAQAFSPTICADTCCLFWGGGDFSMINSDKFILTFHKFLTSPRDYYCRENVSW